METKNELQRPRVMIVDDAGIIRMTVSRILEKEGYEVRVAEDGIRALSMMEESSPDALLIDLKMPTMTGLDLVRVLKSEWPDTEVIIITAYAESDMVRHAGELGAMETVTKPFTDISRLKRLVARAVVETRSRKKRPVQEEALLRQVLLYNGRIDANDFEQAVSDSRRENQNLKSCLIRQGCLSEEGLKRALQDFIRETATDVPGPLQSETM